MKMAKAAKKRSARFSKSVLFYLLAYFFVGAVAGLVVLIPVHGFSGYSRIKLIFIGLFIAFILFGVRHARRFYQKIDWAHPARLLPELLTTIGLVALIMLGFSLTFYFMATGISWLNGMQVFTLVLAGSAVGFIIPFIMDRLYTSALEVEEDEYNLWYYPKDYREKQPVWDRNRLVFPNMVFRPKMMEKRAKVIEVRLPMGANLGEVMYLFIQDFNQNKSPEEPIDNLRWSDDSMGWLFSVPRKTWNLKFGGRTKSYHFGRRYLDTELTVEENRIGEQMNVYFERVIKEREEVTEEEESNEESH